MFCVDFVLIPLKDRHSH